MTVQRIGVQAVIDSSQVAQGLTTYLNALNQINAANSKLRSPSLNLAPVQQQMNNLSSSAIGFSAGIGASIGMAAVSAVNNLTNALSSLSTEIVQNIGFWERLGISAQFVNAEVLMAADATLTMEQALNLAADSADGLISYIQELAILSPFTSQDIGVIYRTAIGFGLTKDAAEALLPLLTDLGAARGLSPEYLERVALAIAQVASRGKLAGEEVRQLGNAGVPIRTILVDALGIANADFDKMLENGEFLASQVIPLIIQSLEKYRGAAKRAALETITGLLSSLQDVREVGLTKFFTAATEEIKTQLQELVNIVSNQRFLASLEVLGQEAGRIMSNIVTAIRTAVTNIINAWNALDPVTKRTIVTFVAVGASLTVLTGVMALMSLAIGALINPFTVLVVTIAGFAAAWANDFYGIKSATEGTINAVTAAFDRLVSDVANVASSVITSTGQIATAFVETLSAAATWGANIVGSFAEGILSAVSTVIQALSVMGQAMAFLLAPGSPPRLLPDLDKWGTEAANVYLTAWTDADFGILDTITSSIRDVLTSLVPTGAVSELDIPTILLGSGQAIAEAINEIRNFGSVSVQTLQEVIRTTGAASEQVVGIIKRYETLSSATLKLERAQQALNDTTEYYDNLLKPLRTQLAAINEAQAQSEEQKELSRLQRVIASQYVSDARKQQAIQRQQEILLQQRIRALEQEQAVAVEGAQEQVDAAQQVTDAAQLELEQYERRIAVQTQQGDLLAEQIRIQEMLNRKVAEGAEKVEKVLSELEKQLKIYQLQQEELDDQIALQEAQAVLEDDKATAAQKYAAQLKINSILVRQQLRDIEAAKLGIDLAEVRAIPIVFEDWGKKGKDAKSAVDDLAASLEGLKNLDVEQAFIDYQVALMLFKNDWNRTKTEMQTSIDELNANLPGPFKLTAEEAGKLPPIIDTITKLLLAWGGLMVVQNLAKVFVFLAGSIGGLKVAAAGAAPFLAPLGAALKTIGTAIIGINPWILAAAAAIAILGVAWGFNVGGMQEKTAEAVDVIKDKFGELSESLSQWSTDTKVWFDSGGMQTMLGEWKTNLEIGIGEAQTVISDYFTNLPTNARIWSSQAGDAYGQILGGTVEGITYWITSGSIKIAQGITGLYTNLTIAINSVDWGGIGQNIQDSLSDMKEADWGGALSTTGTNIGIAFNDMWEFTKTDLLPQISGFVTWIFDTIGGFMTGSVEGLANIFIQVAGGFASGFGQALIDNGAPELGTWWLDVGQNLKDGVFTIQNDTFFADTFKNLTDYIFEQWAGVIGNATDIGKVIWDAVTEVADGYIPDPANAMLEFGKNIVGAVGKGIEDSINSVFESIELFVKFIISTFKSLLGIASPSQVIYDEIGLPIIDGVADALSLAENVKKIVDAIFGIKDAIFSFDVVSQFIADAQKLGGDIAGGITGAITGKLGEAKTGIEDFVNGLLGFGQDEAESRSPSKLFARELGEPIGQGIVEGIGNVPLTIIGEIVKKAVLDAFALMRQNSTAELQMMSTDSLAVINNMTLAIQQAMNVFVTNLLIILSNMVSSVSAWFTTMQTQVLAIMDALDASLLAKWDLIRLTASLSMQTIAALVVGLFQKMKDDSLAIAKALSEEITKILLDLVDKLMDQWVPQGEDLGEDFMKGVEKGMRDRIDDIAKAAADAVKAAIKAAQDAANSQSPSREMRDKVGIPLAQGIEVGWLDEMRKVRDRVFGSISSTITGAQASVVNALGASSPSRISSVTSTNNVTNIRNYNLTLGNGQSTGSVRRDFAIMEIMAI